MPGSSPLVSGCSGAICLLIDGRICWFGIESKLSIGQRIRNSALADYIRKLLNPYTRPSHVSSRQPVVRLANSGHIVAVGSSWTCGSARGIADCPSHIADLADNLSISLSSDDSDAEDLYFQVTGRRMGDTADIDDEDEDEDDEDEDDEDDDEESTPNEEREKRKGKKHEDWLSRHPPMFCHKLAVFDTKKLNTRCHVTEPIHEQQNGVLRSTAPVLHQSRPLVAWYCGSVTIILMDYKSQLMERLTLASEGEQIISCGELRPCTSTMHPS